MPRVESSNAGTPRSLRAQKAGSDTPAASPRIHNFRPDVIGGMLAWHDGDRFTDTVYFTSEEEARRGEQQMAESAPSEFHDWGELVEDVSFLDLRNPWMASR